jgi:hypothetical protein
MHSTLTVRVNIALVVLWTTVLAALLLTITPVPYVTALVGVLFGIPCGLFQKQALSSVSEAITVARTAVEVRKALTSVPPGKRSIKLQWLGAATVLISAALQDQNTIAAFVSGYCSLMLARDIIALKAVMRLGK